VKWRLHTAFDLLAGQLTQVRITTHRVAEDVVHFPTGCATRSKQASKKMSKKLSGQKTREGEKELRECIDVYQ
jgi:hypothetical protein